LKALRKIIRLIRTRKTLTEIYGNEEWMTRLIKCQSEIVRLDGNPYYNSVYKDAEPACWCHLAKWLAEDAKNLSTKRVLDIGCAYGTLSLFCKDLFGADIYCVDVNPGYMSKSLIETYGFRFFSANIEVDELPWRTSFDVILLTEVLEHFNFHPVPTLKKIAGLLSPGGRLYLSTPDSAEWGRQKKYYKKVDDIPKPGAGQMQFIDDHIYHYNKREIMKVVDDSGLRVIRFDYAPGVAERHFNMALAPK